jgi:hypothetical protein
LKGTEQQHILSNFQQQLYQQQQQNGEKARNEFIRERKRPFPDQSFSDNGSEEMNEMKKLHSDSKQKMPQLIISAHFS